MTQGQILLPWKKHPRPHDLRLSASSMQSSEESGQWWRSPKNRLNWVMPRREVHGVLVAAPEAEDLLARILIICRNLGRWETYSE